MISRKSMKRSGETGTDKNGTIEESRGNAADRWPIEMIVERGYGVVTLYRLDKASVDGLFPGERKPGDWGAISVWAWGLSRVVDYLETDDQVDHKRLMVTGTSRLGKAALWAAATDDRIRIAFPMCSGGCGGAAVMSKRFYGEPVDDLMCSIGHDKVCGHFIKYLNHEEVLPFDQHMLIALIAPRPIYIGTADGQKEPHNQGMFLAMKHAEPVYKLLGTDGFGLDSLPEIHQPVMTTMGFHIRSGKHGIEDYDWKCFMDFADRHLHHK
jgi:hypothetical protein